MKLLIISALFSLWSAASVDKAPKNFKDRVFVDFTDAAYEVKYDTSKKSADFVARIKFTQTKKGKPLFDLIERPTKIMINGLPASDELVDSPDSVTKYRSLNTELEPGEHELEIHGSISKNIKFSRGEVSSAFWMSDLTDRNYLEQYLPTNLEYDQFRMSLDVEILNAQKNHVVFSNGSQTKNAKNRFKIEFPAYFTASSVYFHLGPEGEYITESFEFQSQFGKKVPVVAYSKSSWNMLNIKEKIIKILNELEGKFGAWGHPTLTVYIAGMGGMEYSGATMTSLRALGHELTHSYFARGVMPRDGNSGWIDEAVASWRDDGYQTHARPRYSSANMAGFSIYKRTTDRKAYREGAEFMAYLDGKLSDQGGLTKFLSLLYKNYLHSNITTAKFRSELESFSGLDLEEDFKRHVFGKRGKNKSLPPRENPFHPELTPEELKSLL